MIVRKFLSWAQTAAAGDRAEGVSALARAYLYADLSEQDAEDAEVALTAMLDDASPIVRRAIAEAFASAADAPHHIVATLAGDQSDVSTPILARSPLLTDAELVDLAAIGDVFAQSAVALRPALSAGVSAALAEIGCRDAVLVLAENSGADLTDMSARRILQRFDDGEIRESLLARPQVSAALRYDLAQATSRSLADFVGKCGWLGGARLERLEREMREAAAIQVSDGQDSERLAGFVRHMCDLGALNPALLLRGLLSGNRELMLTAFVELSDMPRARVAGLMRDALGSGFAALYAKAGMPIAMLPAFRAALGALRLFPAEGQSTQGRQLSRVLVAHVLSRCGAAGELGPQLLALLRRFEAEAARIAARQIAQDIIDEDKTLNNPQFFALAAVAAALEAPLELQESADRGTAPPVELDEADLEMTEIETPQLAEAA